MNATLSQTAKDYLRDLRRHLHEYQVDGATSAALLADAREGLTGLDDDAAASQIDRLGWPKEVAKNAAQEQGPHGGQKPSLSSAEGLCMGLSVLAIVTALVPIVGLALAAVALVWAITGRRREPGRYRVAMWIAVAALAVNLLFWGSLLMARVVFMSVTSMVETGPIQVGSGVVKLIIDDVAA